MHSRRTQVAGARPSASWLRWSFVLFAIVGAAITCNFVSTFVGTAPTAPQAAGSQPRPTRGGPRVRTAVPPAQLLATEASATIESTAAEQSGPSSPPTYSSLVHCFDVSFDATDGTSVLCQRHLQHLAAVASSINRTAPTTRALAECALKGKDCVAALKAAAATTSSAVPVFVASAAVEATWRDARALPKDKLLATPLRAVTAKYSPVLWHNLLSWSPQATAAAFRSATPADRDPYEDRRAWRHGKREPGVHSKLTDNIIDRPSSSLKVKPCEEEVPASRFAPYSDTIRVLFEGELALLEQQQLEAEASTASPAASTTAAAGAFSTVSSFHTVWAFPGPRKCALERLNGGSHPAITTNSITAFGPGNSWIGYIDNTTGLTEATAALRRISTLAGESKSWVDFVWIHLPKRSPALARHLIRALSTYNPWMGLTAFTACAHTLSGHHDTPAVQLPKDVEASQVIVPAPLTAYSMAAVADCSSNPLFPAAEECHLGPASQDYARLFQVTDDRHSAADGRRVIGALPRVLCVLPIGIDLQAGEPPRGGVDAAFRGYHSVAADYARTIAGGCTRTMVVISIAAHADVVNRAKAFRAQTHRTIVTRAEDGDALLRMYGIDVLADFPVVNRDEDIHITLETSTPCPIDDRAWHASLRVILLGGSTSEMRATKAFQESFQYADGVPRHGDKHFFDLIAIIPEGVAFVPLNLHRFLTRRDVTASEHVLHVPRLYAHPLAAAPTKVPTVAHRFMMMDVHMFVMLHTTLGVKSCPINEADPVFDMWRCVRKLRLKVTNPTEEGKSLVLPAAKGLTASNFAFASIDESETDVVRRWSKP